MALVPRRSRDGKYLVVWNGEVLATYDTRDEQWYHITYGYPAESAKVAEKAAKASSALWSSQKS